EYTNERGGNTLNSISKDLISSNNEQLTDDNYTVNLDNQNIPASIRKSALRPKKGTPREVEIDNTGKYIPKGWERKLYRYVGKNARVGKKHGLYKVRYISPNGNSFTGKFQVSEYIKTLESNGITESLNIEKFDFSLSSHNLPKKRGVKERNYCIPRKKDDVGNIDIYVPDGWQRKLIKNKSGKKHYIVYVSPDYKKIRSHKQMREYLAHLEQKSAPQLVDLERINFSVAKTLDNLSNYLSNECRRRRKLKMNCNT
ncbi:unnamed protein product, partial [Meganyctiphanes norvegica]